MTETLFFGNGFNMLADDKCTSWDTLVKSTNMSINEEQIPNTLLFEYLFIKSAAKTDTQVKERLCADMAYYQSSKELRLLIQKRFTHYISTNFDMAFHDAVRKCYPAIKVKEVNSTEKLYSIRRHYTYTSGNIKKVYWPIHGECARPASIMLSYDHYCRYIAKIQNYIKGEYRTSERDTSPYADRLTDRLTKGITTPFSWIDLFYISNVHMMGFGLSYDEIDIWMLLTDRKRKLLCNNGLIKNKIRYYSIGPMPNGKKDLLTNLGVDIVESSLVDYHKIYGKLINSI